MSTADMCGDATTPVRTRQVYSGLATIQEYVWCATAGEWTAAREFLYGASFLEPVALVDWSDLGDEEAGTEEVLHYVHDRLGSVVALTDAGDPNDPNDLPQAVERYEYDPYGQTYIEVWDEGSSQWVSASESKYGNQLLWTAQRFDATVGLYHFPARAYSPRLGRWLQRDPLGYVDGVNLYEYVGSAPTMFIDPMGLMLGWRPPDGSMPSPGDYVAHDDGYGYGGGGWHPPWLPPDDNPFDDGFVGPPPPDPCPDDGSSDPSGSEGGDDDGNKPPSLPPNDPFDPNYDPLRDHVNQAREWEAKFRELFNKLKNDPSLANDPDFIIEASRIGNDFLQNQLGGAINSARDQLAAADPGNMTLTISGDPLGVGGEVSGTMDQWSNTGGAAAEDTGGWLDDAIDWIGDVLTDIGEYENEQIQEYWPPGKM